MQTVPTPNRIINKPRRVMRNAFILAALMIVGAIVTGYSNLDGMNGGYALIVFFVFFAMSSLVTAVVYISRAKEFDKLMNELNPLAHWVYTKQEWDAFIEEDQQEMISINKATLRLVITVSVVVCGILLCIYRDTLFILIISGIILMLTLVAFLAPRIRSYILKKGVREAYIGTKAAFVGGTFQTWTQLGAHLIAADIYTESAIPMLHIIFEFPTLHATQQEIIRVPVPSGQLAQAKKIVEHLRKQIN